MMIRRATLTVFGAAMLTGAFVGQPAQAVESQPGQAMESQKDRCGCEMQDGMKHEHGRMGHDAARMMEDRVMYKVDRLLEEARATESQEKQVRGIVREVLPKMQEAREKRMAMEKELAGLWKDPEANRQKIYGLVDQISELRKAERHQMVDARIRVLALFNPEQRERLAELEEYRHGYMGRRGPMMGEREYREWEG